MANRADIIVKNSFFNSIQVVRNPVEGVCDLETMITKGSREKIHLPGPEASLIVQAPTEMDIKDSPLQVRSDVDLIISYSRTQSRWTFKIESNSLPSDAPDTVNISIGDDEPE